MKDILKDYKDMLEGFGSVLDDEEVITGNIVEEQIREWLKENCDIIGTYKIFQEDNSYYVDVNSSIEITNNSIERFPVELFQFNYINGNFDCSECENLKSLEGAPKEIGGSFYCMNCTNLTSLKGAPERVSCSFNCGGCTRLSSLEGAPKKVSKSFYCDRCSSLKSLKSGPERVGFIFDCSDCTSLISLEGAPKEVGHNFICNTCIRLQTLRGITAQCRILSCIGCTSLKTLKEGPKTIKYDLYISGCDTLLSLYPDIERIARKNINIGGQIIISLTYATRC